MSTTRTIALSNRLAGVLSDLDSAPVLRDPTAAYGVRRADTLAVVVAAGTAFTRDAAGEYSYAVTGLVEGVAYQAYVETVLNGETTRTPMTWTQSADADTAGAYCTLSEADAIAASLPGLAKYKAAASLLRAAALIQGSDDVDNAGPWQGRRYDLWTPQAREFPRVPYQSASQCAGWGGLGDWLASGFGAAGLQVWDWDVATNAAVVPPKVKAAVVWQADSIIDGRLEKALNDMALGVEAKAAGSVSVAYRDPAAIVAVFGGGGALGGLCRRAELLIKGYRLKQGRIL